MVLQKKQEARLIVFKYKSLLLFPEWLMHIFLKFGCLMFREEMKLRIYIGCYRSIYSVFSIFNFSSLILAYLLSYLFKGYKIIKIVAHLKNIKF